MELVFLGHQSWLVRKNETTLLIDPLLRDTFGVDPIAGFRIYPPREIDPAGIGSVTAVFLSHEHGDHFDLPSLATLPRGTMIYVGCTISAAVTDAIEALGYPTKRVPGRCTLEIGDLLVDVYAAGNGTAFWESRVRQLLIQSRDDVDESVFIAVDALVSESFMSDVRTSKVGKPRAIAVSNNSQIAPRGLYGSLDNLAVSDDVLPSKNGLTGLGILYEVLVNYLDGMPDVEALLICGGGFMKAYDEYGPFQFSDQDAIARVGDALSLVTKVSGPLPGDRYVIASGEPIRSDRVEWVTLDIDAARELRTLSDDFQSAKKTTVLVPRAAPFADRAAFARAAAFIGVELERVAHAIPTVDVGVRALGLDEYRGRSLDGKRIAFRLLGETHDDGSSSEDRVWVLDLAAGRFVPFLLDGKTPPTAQLIELFPFGVELHLRDYYGLVTGEFQIWDLVGLAVRSWYVGDMFDGIVPFFYTFYGENVDIANATRLLERRAKQIRESCEVASCV